MKSLNNLATKLAGSSQVVVWMLTRSAYSNLALWRTTPTVLYNLFTLITHTDLVNVQLNSTMRLISGTLCSTTFILWLPVVSNTEPLALRQKPAADAHTVKITAPKQWSVYSVQFRRVL